MSLPAHRMYRESGVKELGDLPEHWSVRRYKGVFAERDERSDTGQETLLSVSAYTGVSPRAEIIQEGDYLSRAESLEGYKVCYPDDLVMNIMLAWNRGLGFAAQHGIVSPAYAVFRPLAGNHPRFLDYMVRSDRVTLYFKAFSSGVIESRLRLYPDTFGSLSCILPPLSEQRVIAAFLDRETAKIDALIAEQERLLTLLAEKRLATISHAVTKGLNPDAPMMDSGVEWLGEVPAHWEVSSLKRYWTVTDCKHLTADFVDEGIPLASIREVQSKYVVLDAAKRTTDFFYEQLIEGGRAPLAGDLIFSRNATVGEVAQVTKDHPRFAMGQDVCLLRKKNECYSSDYLQAVIGSRLVREQLKNIMVGSTFKRVNVDDIRSLVIPMPPADEQHEIASFVNKELATLAALENEVARVNKLLTERRGALIAAAVTGKIDVRGAVPVEQLCVDSAASQVPPQK